MFSELLHASHAGGSSIVPVPFHPQSVQHIRKGYYYIKATELNTEGIVATEQTAVMSSW